MTEASARCSSRIMVAAIDITFPFEAVSRLHAQQFGQHRDDEAEANHINQEGQENEDERGVAGLSHAAGMMNDER